MPLLFATDEASPPGEVVAAFSPASAGAAGSDGGSAVYELPKSAVHGRAIPTKSNSANKLERNGEVATINNPKKATTSNEGCPKRRGRTCDRQGFRAHPFDSR